MKYQTGKGKSAQHTSDRTHNFGVRLLAIIILFAVLLSACARGPVPSTPGSVVEDTATPVPPTATEVPPTVTPEASVDLDGTYWTLVSYVDDEGNTVDVLSDTTIDAEFAADQIAGSAGCNRYFGSYERDGGNLTFGLLGMTEMYCEPKALMYQEVAYLSILADVATYKVLNGQLHFIDAEGVIVLTFTQAETVDEATLIDLEGTHWTLVSYVDNAGSVVSVLRDTIIDAEFTVDQIVGRAGCNRYFGSYQTDGGNLTLGPIGATRMACGGSVDKQELRYLAALESAVAYEVLEGHLYFVDAEGTIVLTFAKAESAAVPEWTEKTLQNATYTIEGIDGDVQLVNGEYEHKYGDGATMVNKVGVVDVALGDLDGDGDDDAAVILWWQSGGSGTFLYIAAVRNDDGVPQQAGMLSLGDRVQPGEFTIADGSIILMALTHAPDDPMCCPSQKTIQTYALENDTLALVASETTMPELVGPVWMWVRFDDMAGENNIVVDDPTQYTLEFIADGTYRLKADCNQGGGGYTVDGNSLTLGPGPMTLAACGPESLYDDYVKNLVDVVTFVFDGENLILNLKMEAGNMVFTPIE